MKCKHAKKMLPLYIGGELSKSQRIRTKAHLSSCGDCRTHLQLILRTQDIMQQAFSEGDETNLTHIWPQVHAEITSQGIYSRRIEQGFRVLELSFASVVLLAVIVITAFTLRAPDKITTDVPLAGPLPAEEITVADYPVVEEVDMPGVTVLTMETDDPHVKIVWFLGD